MENIKTLRNDKKKMLFIKRKNLLNNKTKMRLYNCDNKYTCILITNKPFKKRLITFEL